MEKKSIGNFLAALRKASGYTQEEVAQRLFVSNKTISKWERDESSPDLATIPVLAELFQVTCDEILRGERIPPELVDEGKSRAKTEKQVRHIYNRTIIQFMSMSSIAAALTVMGLILQFAVGYTFYKPLVAFGLAVICLLGSIVLEMMQLIRAKGALQEGFLLEEGKLLPSDHTRRFHRIAFSIVLFNLWAFLAILPMVMAEGLDFAHSVLSFDTYLSLIPQQAVFCLVLTAATMYFARKWLDYDINKIEILALLRYHTANIRHLARTQEGLLVYLLIQLILPKVIFLATGDRGMIVVGITSLILLVLCLIVFVVTFIRMLREGKGRLERLMLCCMSVRNVLYAYAMILTLQYIIITYSSDDPTPRLDLQNGMSAWLFQMTLITMAYFAIKYFLVKNLKGSNVPEPTPQESDI